MAEKFLSALTAATTPLAKTDLGMVSRPSESSNGKKVELDHLKRFTDGFQAAVATDADFTLTVFTNAEAIRHTGTLTADRAVTLSTTGAYSGARFHVTRTGGGAFNLNVGTGPLKGLATNTWGEFIYDGAAWYLAAYGAL